MKVNATVFSMMRSYPTLYRTRVMALARLFDSYDTEWVNGELIDKEPRTSLGVPPATPADAGELDEGLKAHNELVKRLEKAKKDFVYDNAALLSEDPYSSFSKRSSIRFAGRHFDDMPPDVTPDWLAAAKELAMAISSHKFFPDRVYAPDYLARAHAETEESALICRQFLERFKVVQVSDWERSSRIEKLTREALALGLTLRQL